MLSKSLMACFPRVFRKGSTRIGHQEHIISLFDQAKSGEGRTDFG